MLDNPVAHLNLGDLLLSMAESQADQGRAKPLFERAVEEYDRVLKLQPAQVEAVNNKAWVLHTYLGRSQEALELTQDLLKRAHPATLPGEFYDTLGAIQEALGRDGRRRGVVPVGAPEVARAPGAQLPLRQAAGQGGKPHRAGQGLSRQGPGQSRPARPGRWPGTRSTSSSSSAGPSRGTEPTSSPSLRPVAEAGRLARTSASLLFAGRGGSAGAWPSPLCTRLAFRLGASQGIVHASILSIRRSPPLGVTRVPTLHKGVEPMPAQAFCPPLLIVVFGRMVSLSPSQPEVPQGGWILPGHAASSGVRAVARRMPCPCKPRPGRWERSGVGWHLATAPANPLDRSRAPVC